MDLSNHYKKTWNLLHFLSCIGVYIAYTSGFRVLKYGFIISCPCMMQVMCLRILLSSISCRGSASEANPKDDIIVGWKIEHSVSCGHDGFMYGCTSMN